MVTEDAAEDIMRSVRGVRRAASRARAGGRRPTASSIQKHRILVGIVFERCNRPDASTTREVKKAAHPRPRVAYGSSARRARGRGATTTTGDARARRSTHARRARGATARAAIAVIAAVCATTTTTTTTATAIGAARAASTRAVRYGARRDVGGEGRLGTTRARASSSSVDDARAMASYPAPIVVEPRGGDANAAMILLHGLGDTGRGWAGAARQIPTPAGAHVRWVFPTAKTMPVTLNGGMRMTAWFDLNALDERSIVDDRGEIDASVEYLNALVREQMDKGIPSEKIMIGGFSQGGAIALTAALRSEVKLAGCVAMSTYLPLRADYPDRFGAHAKSLKIFQAHGTSDMVLQYSYGKMSAELMQAAGVDVDFKTYNGMAHSACAEEFDDVADFLKARLAG